MYKKFIYQILFVMRLTIVVLILGMMQVSAISFAQKVTYVKKQATLEEIFEVIRVQTGYNVFYSSNKIDDSKKMDVRFKDTELKAVLDLCAEKQSLAYTIEAKNIFFKAKEKNIVDKIISLFSAIDVRGKVVDENGEPLQGATVKVKGGTLGTMTDKEGEFLLRGTSDDAVIVIAFLGYKPLERKVDVDMGVIKMELKTSELNEVTVSTGYFETSKRLSVGNIAKITAKEIGNQPVVSPLLALQGRVAGLEITMPANATPGVAPTIRIRGNNSLRMLGKENVGVTEEQDGNYPLYVIDGVPVISSPLITGAGGHSLTTGGFDPISTINPANIESIEILKDADATAIYGSRGANGVILITTKQNKGSERTNLELSSYRGGGQVSRKLSLLNTQQYLAMRQEALSNYGAPVSDFYYDLKYWDPSRYTDWQEVLLGGASNITDVQANVTGGSKNTSFRIGGGFHKETLIISSDFGYKRASGNASFNHASNNQRLKIAANLNYGMDYKDLFADDQGNIVRLALTLAPNAPKLYNDDGSLNWEIHNVQGKPQATWVNPLAAQRKEQNATSRNLISNINLNYKVVSGLSVLLSAGYTDLSNREKLIIPLTAYSPLDMGLEGMATNYEIHRNSWIIEPKITYSHNIKKHKFDFLFGTSWQETNSSTLVIGADKYASDVLLGSLLGAGRVTIYRDDYAEYKYWSMYGRIGYNWQQKYLMNFTGRRDASSRFAPNKRAGNFGSIGLGWIFSEEPFIQRNVPFISFSKLRGSYGIIGSDAVGDYQFYNLYDLRSESYDGVRGLVPSALYNPEFVWETTKKLELGLEMGFLGDRFGLEMSWYLNRSSNQLINYTMPYTTGFPSVVSNFNATVQNTGLEAVFRAEPIATKNWRWNISFNTSIPRNKLVKFDDIENSPYVNAFKVGAPLSIQWLYNWTGVNSLTGLHTFADENKDGVISNVDKRLMSPMDSKYYGGMNNTIRYKLFELSIQLQYSNKPGFRYLPDFLPGIGNQSVEVLNRWFTSGDQTDIQKFAPFGVITSSGFSTSTDAYVAYVKALQSNYKVQDASFIRLKSLLFTYVLPSRLLQKIKFQQMKFFIQGQNLVTITGYKGLDPETGSGLPPLRMATVGLQINL